MTEAPPITNGKSWVFPAIVVLLDDETDPLSPTFTASCYHRETERIIKQDYQVSPAHWEHFKSDPAFIKAMKRDILFDLITHLIEKGLVDA